MSDDRDLELGAALRGLPTPEHDGGFWAELEDRLAGGAALPDVTTLRTRGFVLRTRWFLSAAAAIAVVVAAVAVLDGGQDTRLRVTPPATAPEKASWSTISASPLSARSGHSAVWTGRRMLVWGGAGPDDQPLLDGASYDPATDRWVPMAEAPTALFAATAVWTGRRMLVWGGMAATPQDPATEKAAGAAYDPATDTWTPISSSPLRTVAGHVAAWTGERMLVWGGSVGESPTAEGASYDPATDRWTKLADAPIEPRFDHTGVWTGDRLIVWGGFSGEESASTVAFADGAAYDPASDSWTKLAAAPVAGRALHAVVWTGRTMVVWGGSGSTYRAIPDGASYDPALGSWKVLATSPLGPRVFQTAVAAGGSMLVWGGRGDDGNGRADGAAYDPAGDAWSALPESPLAPRSRLSAVWTGTAMIVWGGAGAAQDLHADGAALRPATRS